MNIGPAYENFDLLIEPHTNGYQARVLNSPAGQTTSPLPFTLPFSVEEASQVVSLVREVRHLRTYQVGDTQRVKALDPQTFGQQLFAAVFQGEVHTCLMRSLALVEQKKLGLRLRLRLNDVPQLIDLPWEYLYGPPPYGFFCLSAQTPIVRYLEVMSPEEPLAVTFPLRILTMISNPNDHNVPRLNVEREWGQIQAALADLQQRGLVILERLPVATLASLQQRLRQPEPVHVFHFMGHGTFDPAQKATGLLLENSNQQGLLVPAEKLRLHFRDHPSLRLAVLNACEGAQTGQSNPFAGIAQSLVQWGMPAVIAMQSAVTDRAAIRLAHEFYQALAANYPVDAALAEARKALDSENSLEWGIPVLYMRTALGRLFTVDQPATPPSAAPKAVLSSPPTVGASGQPGATPSPRQLLANLRNLLADLYPDETSTRRVVADAGMDARRIAFSSQAINNWYAILTEATKAGQLDALLNIVLEDYSTNQALQAASAAYRASRPQG